MKFSALVSYNSTLLLFLSRKKVENIFSLGEHMTVFLKFKAFMKEVQTRGKKISKRLKNTFHAFLTNAFLSVLFTFSSLLLTG